MEKQIKIKIKITGKVQGVGFRYHTQKAAEEIGIKGFVKNEYDGSVYIEASGESDKIDLFVNWCHQGPKWALVENVALKDNELKKFKSFKIL